MNKPVLLDVMLNGNFLCQYRYFARGFPKLINGKIQEVYDMRDFRRFVEEKRPSLKGRNYQVLVSDQSVFK